MWSITDGTTTQTITVMNAPALDRSMAVETYAAASGIKTRGDRLPEPKPMAVEIGIQEPTFDAAMSVLTTIEAIARSGSATLQYVEGGETISRSIADLAGFEATELFPDQGIIRVRFRFLPDSAYWNSSTRGNVIWIW